MNKTNIEIEAHFLEVDISQIRKRLKKVGAEELGEDYLHEIIFYDKALTWKDKPCLLRMRSRKGITTLSFKDFQNVENDNSSKVNQVVKEIELSVDDWDQAKLLLESIGLVAYREQEKKRHSYQFDDVLVDIDTWPSIPSYVEIEGPSHKKVQEVAEKLGFDWKDAVFRGAGYIIEHYYHIKVSDLTSFTFEKIG